MDDLENITRGEHLTGASGPAVNENWAFPIRAQNRSCELARPLDGQPRKRHVLDGSAENDAHGRIWLKLLGERRARR